MQAAEKKYIYNYRKRLTLNSSSSCYLTIIRQRRIEYSQMWIFNNIFTEPEENNCFSIIGQVIIRANAFSFILLIFS